MNALYVHINFESDLPIYEQLKNELKRGIAQNLLRAGERLPSVRDMATDIGINLHTVNKAYKQLQQEGYLQIHRQRGVVVHPDGPPVTDEAHIQQLREVMQPLIVDAICRKLSQAEFEALCHDLFTEVTEGKTDE